MQEQTPTPGDNKLNKDPIHANKLGNDIDPPKAGKPDVIKPSLPLKKWRSLSRPIPTDEPFGIRPGEGPISGASSKR